MEKYSPGVGERRYTELENERSPYLHRARECAKLTIPSLMPPDGSNSYTKFFTPYQGIGARGVNHLAAKLLLALIPPNSPFFRMRVADHVLEKMQLDPAVKTEIEKALGKFERAVMTEIETSGDRVAFFEDLKHLIVAGNVLLYVGTEGSRAFHLDRYVVKRDPSGTILEIVVKESVSPNSLSDEVREAIKGTMTGDDKTVNLFTYVRKEGNKYIVHQESNGVVIPGSEGSYLQDRTPWIPLRYTRIDGEDYGRGFVEEYLGDLRTLEGLTKAIVQGAAAASKVLFLVNPNGVTSQQTLSNSESGDIRAGNAEDVSVLQMEKYADFRIAFEVIQRIETRLSLAFLLHSTVQREAERVTAEEVRYMASELEDALGGVYSILSQEFQLPYVQRKIAMMQKRKMLPALPKEMVKPSIVTGLEALGRGHDLRKLDLFIAGVFETLGPEIAQQVLNLDDYMKRRATALGIDTEGLIKTPEEQAAAAQQAQMAAMVQSLGPEAIKQMGNVAQSQQQGTA